MESVLLDVAGHRRSPARLAFSQAGLAAATALFLGALVSACSRQADTTIG